MLVPWRLKKAICQLASGGAEASDTIVRSSALMKIASLSIPLALTTSPTSFSLRYISAVSMCLTSKSYMTGSGRTVDMILIGAPIPDFESFSQTRLRQLGRIFNFSESIGDTKPELRYLIACTRLIH